MCCSIRASAAQFTSSSSACADWLFDIGTSSLRCFDQILSVRQLVIVAFSGILGKVLHELPIVALSIIEVPALPVRMLIGRRGVSVSSRLHSFVQRFEDRKSTRLNSSHGYSSYAVFCLKKKIATHWTVDFKGKRCGWAGETCHAVSVTTIVKSVAGQPALLTERDPEMVRVVPARNAGLD